MCVGGCMYIYIYIYIYIYVFPRSHSRPSPRHWASIRRPRNWYELCHMACLLFFITFKPKFEWYNSLWALNTSPPHVACSTARGQRRDSFRMCFSVTTLFWTEIGHELVTCPMGFRCANVKTRTFYVNHILISTVLPTSGFFHSEIVQDFCALAPTIFRPWYQL